MLRVLLAILAALTLAPTLLADGKIFRHGVPEMPPIPDQQAIIAWDAATNTQTLAIETRFDAGATSSAESQFCWVVPLPGPAAPRITAATPGLFPTVRAVFQPRVDDRRGSDTAPITVSLAVLFTVYVLLKRWNWPGWASAVMVVAIVFFVLIAMLPTLGTARSSARGGSPGDAVQVLDRSIVGSYDMAVIGASEGASPADSGKAISTWLADNGFPLPASAAPVIADYAARKWVFAAIKLRPEAASGGKLTPHPLVFRFATPKAVYPMALTGVGNAPLTLDLYVFGPSRAAAAGLREVRCDTVRPVLASGGPLGMMPESCVPVGHAGLAEIVGKQFVATKLSGTLAPAVQAKDMDITWKEFARSGSHKFSPRAAAFRGIDWGAAVICVGMLAIMVAGTLDTRGPAWTLRHLWLAPALGAIVGLVVYAATPTVPVRGRESARAARWNTRRVTNDLAYSLSERFERARSMPSEEEVRKAIDEIAKEGRFEVRAEDSPGNYVIERRESPESLTYVGFDVVGAAHRTVIWEK